MNTTKKVKAMRGQLIDHAATVYEEVKEKAVQSKQFQKMSKNEFVAMVTGAVDKYAVKNGMADNIKRMVIKIVSSQYSNLKAEVKKRKK